MPDRIADIWGPRTPFDRDGTWPVRVDGFTTAEPERWVPSACLLCSNGCGIDLGVADGRIVGVRGRAGDRVNHGRLGPKGLFGWQGQQRDRLTTALVRDASGVLVETSYDEAMDLVVRCSRELLDAKGPLSHGFYTSGQLMLEEYYTLAVIGKAGIGTPHMDGNTRLCTATAAAALKESFGADGQPGSYTDVDSTDAVFLWGHNMAETQTVLWSRILDRTHGARPPVLVAVDPRLTPVAREALRTGGVHLPVRSGTNLALVNALTRELLVHGWVDEAWVAEHAAGLDALREVVEGYTPERAAEICGVDPDGIRRAAEIFGTSGRVLSTVLQGFYQSHQATAASCAVDNLHLLRGMLGRPGCGILQMNGQPTAQNNRECGADGDLPGFRNWDNEAHVAELAELWNVDPLTIPHWAPPTHAMQLFRYAEQGSIGFLWIAGTNPAVSLPELARIRDVLSADRCFVVVSDAYRTETTELADVVLPAALWGERTGCYTNVDRTVHLSRQAVEPPGDARSDLAIWVDYARRMGFTDRDGNPLPAWSEPEEAFEAWKAASKGRPCDYSGLSYGRLDGAGGIQWPCTAERPEGTERLYTDAVFPTATGYCETYGHDLLTGAAVTREQHAAKGLDGRAWLRAAHYTPPHEAPSDERPFVLTTGRTAYHFHTRTKTGRAPQLAAAAPAMWFELSIRDAERCGVTEGDVVRVANARGAVEAPVRITHGRDGTVFAPFHYGDHPANELTQTTWDPVSKQPVFKVAAVAVTPVRRGDGPAPAPTTTASAPAAGGVPPTAGGTAAEATSTLGET
ncbi:MAG TPA: molybdopterin-dependent oxidoreductase [Mycobacteriales bacterium]